MCACMSSVVCGRTTIALNHLPSGRVVEKWYQMGNKENQNAAVSHDALCAPLVRVQHSTCDSIVYAATS